MKSLYSLFPFLAVLGVLAACNSGPSSRCEPQERDSILLKYDAVIQHLSEPDDLEIVPFSGPNLTPSPSCLAVTPDGVVFVGVDKIGSLGKTPGEGAIVRLEDCNNDGIVDKHTVFAKVNNPRGIMPVGDKVYVLHTHFDEEGIADEEDLVVFEDKNKDGVADGDPKILVQGMGNRVYLAKRGTDHATNGIRMGIDGWIYISAGDYGFYKAKGTDGTEITMLGGGIVRVRPDGTEMEIYVHGTRNIYDAAIDPYMNIYTRDNTNDGGGWNIRFSHMIQSGEYGYPTLFKHFTEEIIPALEDLGGGSGTGAYFMSEPSWPAKYNEVPMMADWGRSELYIHRLTPDGPTYTQKQEDFIKLPQITDVDVDGSGRMYLSAWDGAGFGGDSTKGFVVRVVPKDWEYKAFPDLGKAAESELKGLLSSGSAVARFAAQHELLSKSSKMANQVGLEVATDTKLSVPARIAGLYTYLQTAQKEGIENLVKLSQEADMKEYVLRALADREIILKEVPLKVFVEALKDTSERVQAAAIIALGRTGNKEAIPPLMAIPVPASFSEVPFGEEGPHATPNSEIILPHLAVRALVRLQATSACVGAIGTAQSALALWALRYMHSEEAVKGLIEAYGKSDDSDLKKNIIFTLARIYHKEADYDGSWWWGTRPDTHGPYYNGIDWEGTPLIKDFLLSVSQSGKPFGKPFFKDLNLKYRLGIHAFGGDEDQLEAKNAETFNFEKIKDKKGQVGESSQGKVLQAIENMKGDPEIGKKIFMQQGCIACHSLKPGDKLKGPFLGQIGGIMDRNEIAKSILDPDASIAQGFSTVKVTTKSGETFVGFVTAQSSKRIILRDITGGIHVITSEEIKDREELNGSMMPKGLANGLSLEEFASLVTFLSEQKN